MKQVSKTAIRKEFLKDLGLALWLERRSRRLSIKKVEKKAGVPSWIIDRIERGLVGSEMCIRDSSCKGG